MIFNTSSLFSSGNNSDNYQSSSVSPVYDSSKFYVHSDFHDAKIIKNMFIDDNGSLCKHNSTKTILQHTSTIKSIKKIILNNTEYVFFIDADSILWKTYMDTDTNEYVAPISCGYIHSDNDNIDVSKYYIFAANNIVYIIGNGVYYQYDNDILKTVEVYVPLLSRYTNGLDTDSTKVEDINILSNQAHKMYITDGNSREYRINNSQYNIQNVDSVFFDGTKLGASDYSAYTRSSYISINTTSLYSTANDDLNVYFTFARNSNIDKSTILNPDFISVINNDNINTLCVCKYNNIYFSGIPNIHLDDSSVEQLGINTAPVTYFPDNSEMNIDKSELNGDVVAIVPLNKNKFAIVTSSGYVYVYLLDSYSEIVNKDEKQYCRTPYRDLLCTYYIGDILITRNHICYDNNNLYILNNNSVYKVTIDDNGNCQTNILFKNIINKELSKTVDINKNNYRMFIDNNKQYLYLFNKQYDTIVIDLLHESVYVYDGDFRIDTFVSDTIFLNSAQNSIVSISNNDYGMCDSQFFTGIYQSDIINFGTYHTKYLDSIYLNTESLDTDAITCNTSINISTDNNDIDETITETVDLALADTFIPTVSEIKSDSLSNKKINHASINAILPSNIYRLNNIIFEREILDEIVPTSEL